MSGWTDVGCVLTHATKGRKSQPVAKAHCTRGTPMQRRLRGDLMDAVAFSCWARVVRVSRKRAARAQIYCCKKCIFAKFFFKQDIKTLQTEILKILSKVFSLIALANAKFLKEHVANAKIDFNDKLLKSANCRKLMSAR